MFFYFQITTRATFVILTSVVCPEKMTQLENNVFLIFFLNSLFPCSSLLFWQLPPCLTILCPYSASWLPRGLLSPCLWLPAPHTGGASPKKHHMIPSWVCPPRSPPSLPRMSFLWIPVSFQPGRQSDQLSPCQVLNRQKQLMCDPFHGHLCFSSEEGLELTEFQTPYWAIGEMHI